MAQDKVQLKREEVVGNDTVMQDINPKTKTNSITDSTKGVPLDQTIAMIKNMINNKLSRVVNSVNGRTGVVILDAGDVGLENVDNISFGDIKRWVIDYMGDIFGSKKIILEEYLSQISTIIGTNDKAYADRPFYCQKGSESNSDYMAYIGYIYWDEEHEKLGEQHLQIKVVGFTDRSLRYNVANTPYANGGCGVNIWKGEDALKVMNNALSYSGHSAEDLDNSGLYIDKSKVVPDVYFFDGVYGTLYSSEGYMHNQDGLVYWTTDPNDVTEETLPTIQILINGIEINKSSSGGGTVTTLHKSQQFKVGDIIITNFSYTDYFGPDDVSYVNKTYPKIVDALTCRQPAIGRIVQAASDENDNVYIVKFHIMKPNVSHGLKLITTDSYYIQSPTDTAIGLDLLSATPKMSDDTEISDEVFNVSGLNALDQYDLASRRPKANTTRRLYTIFPTGKSSNILEDTNGQVECNSAYIMPNFSMCVIPGYTFVNENDGLISNWNPSSPINSNDHSQEYVVGQREWNMLGLNLEKKIFDGETTDDHKYARNISGLRVNNDTDAISESWFGHGAGSSGIVDLHSGGVSVNVGDFLGIGSVEELNDTNPTTRSTFYDEGKVNVRIDKMKGLHGVEGNRLGVNLANGSIYQPTSGSVKSTWFEGGLKFLPSTEISPDKGPIAVNTGSSSTGLSVKNNFLIEPRTRNFGNGKNYKYASNVLTVQPLEFSSKVGTGTSAVVLDDSPLEIHVGVCEEDISHNIPVKNICTDKVWESLSSMISDREYNRFTFNESTIYVAGGEKYIYWLDSGQPTFDKYFVFYWEDPVEYTLIEGIGDDHTEQPLGWDPTQCFKQDIYGKWIRGSVGDAWVVNTWYSRNDRDYDIAIDVMNTGTVPPSTDIKPASVLRRQCHILIETKDPTTNPNEYNVTVSMYQPSTDGLRFPDFDRNGIVTNVEATDVNRFFMKLANAIDVYSDQSHTNFYTDSTLTTPLVPTKGYKYRDLNQSIKDPDKPEHDYCMLYVGYEDPQTHVVSLRKYQIHEGIDPTLEEIMSADVNRDGQINFKDQSLIQDYFSATSTGRYSDLTPTESWRKYLREDVGINVEDGTGSVVTISEFTYVKGLHMRYNELKGLTTNPEYFGTINMDSSHPQRSICEMDPNTMMRNDMRNSLSIKIADPSSGMYSFDAIHAGGLRFGSDGYLSVRVNGNNEFSSIFPSMNSKFSVDELNVGSHGLRIYGAEDTALRGINVLGVQLTEDGQLDNGELRIDSSGCLRLSSGITVNNENLTISGVYEDGTSAEVEYNGSEPITINLGPGLCFSTPNQG